MNNAKVTILVIVYITIVIGSQAVVAADPPLEFSTWGMPGSPRFSVTLDNDGTLTVEREAMGKGVPVRRKVVVKMKAAQRDALLSLAANASDFNVQCETIADGTSARMKLVTAERVIQRECLMAKTWPVGAKTQQFLDRLNAALPADFHVF